MALERGLLGSASNGQGFASSKDTYDYPSLVSLLSQMLIGRITYLFVLLVHCFVSSPRLLRGR